MKKLLYTTIIAVVSLFAASCEQEHIEAIYNPEAVTAQTLGEISGVVLDAEGEAVTVTFNPADFNMPVATSYALNASASSDMTDKVKVSAKIAIADGIGTITMLQKDLNSLIYSLGGVADEPFTVYFQLAASIANDKNGAIDSTTSVSNVVAATFTPYSTVVKDVDLFEHVWVIGASANVGSWSFDNVFQFLYDYEKTGNTFTGVIDFGEAGPSGGFKLVGVGNWNDESKNWGSEAQAEEAEVATIQLIASGGSKDIKCYSKRYYSFSFNTSTLVLTKAASFDNIGIVGAFNGWNAADANLKMTYNPYFHRFYIDYTFDAATELKFTCDDNWDTNWGGKDGTTSPGGDNIAVEAGSYRIYLDINKSSYELSTSMFGKDEPTGEETGGGDEPEPETYKGWGIIGGFNEWGGDAPMTEKAGVWTGYFTNTAGGEFKVRKDADWAENYGGTIVSLGTAFEAVAGGDNLVTADAGFYKVVLDLTGDVAMLTVSEGNVWSLIGGFNEWSGDVDMEEVDGKWVSPATKISGEFKVRHNHDWGENRGGTLASIGVAFDAVAGGDNINVPEGEYIVTYDPTAETILVEGALPANTWSLIGVNGDWNNDIFMTQLASGIWVSAPTAINGEFKIRFNHDWGVNRGAAETTVGVAFAAVQDGGNLNVADGTYQVVYNPMLDLITINNCTNGWSVIGQFEGHNWDYDLYLSADGSSETFLVDGTFKIRYNGGWDENRGGTFAADGEAFDAVPGGDNINVGTDAVNNYYKLNYDATAEKIIVTKAWCIVGQVNGTSWDKDFPMTEVAKGVWESSVTVNGEFKIRKSGDWGVNRGGTLAELGTAFAVENNGSNIAVPTADKKYKISYDAAAETITVVEL